MEKEIFVEKVNGEKEVFSFEKIFQSIKNSGLDEKLAREIALKIQKKIYPGIKTSQIYKEISKYLSKKSFLAAIKFRLKKAILELGPTGFPFEKFIGKVFEAEGFEVKLNQIISGFCTKYEIDFLAKKGNLIYIGECKFRNELEGKVDLRDALANYARFLDIKNGKFFNTKMKYKSILVTNAKFTLEAIKYSKCVGVLLLGWKYPKEGGLEYLIEKNKFYPITILPSVNKSLAQELIENGIVLVRDVFGGKFDSLKIREKNKILKEAEILLKE